MNVAKAVRGVVPVIQTDGFDTGADGALVMLVPEFLLVTGRCGGTDFHFQVPLESIISALSAQTKDLGQ